MASSIAARLPTSSPASKSLAFFSFQPIPQSLPVYSHSRHTRFPFLVHASTGDDLSTRTDASEVTSPSSSSSSSSPTTTEFASPAAQSSPVTTNKQPSSVSLSLEDVNPVGLGRRSRQLFDEVWRRLTDLGQLTSRDSTEYESEMIGGPMCEFTTPGAESTTVLVAGATSRVGRIVIRKLQLRGYKVKALVRKDDPETLELLPRSVQIAVGDLGDPFSLKNAVEGCSKIIFCARARSSLTVDLNRVDKQGVYNLSKAFQDYNHKMAQARAGRSSRSKLLISKFKEKDEWSCQQGTYFTDDFAVKYDGGMNANLSTEEDGKVVFSGYVFTRGGYVELTKKLNLAPGVSLDRYEGLVLSVCGDGKIYSLILEACSMDDPSHKIIYAARFATRLGYSRVRIPFSSFRPMNPEDPALDPFSVHTIAIRFEPRKQRSASRSASSIPSSLRDLNSFKLTLDYIKALPAGQETDFILISCTGAGVDEIDREKVLKAKQAGEAALRNSGLGYTIIRPGPLQDEPGGQRALVFDQGNRISQGISYADVADICVKALHNPAARNRSFDVCYEYVAEQGQGLYELVAHLPDKSNNYLTPALSVLERNT
ncbi:hypothetical protein KP509_24G028300 [Ceratopteris richardii]|uniref:Uncharacterized protein n=1 Tax=Ceratopteris richardii TaxID=49495 RepID=A0A8T2RTD0_CERRI|nr:hypothetical protein KP509_24G028300 [Ceratopteris richardii]